jgi:hypothetical protein
MNSNSNITAIVTCYKRKSFKDVFDAVRQQTIPPEKIIIWNNMPHRGSNQIILDEGDKSVLVINSDPNSGTYGRFAAGMLAETEFIAIFDDDTVPGNKWFENCMNTYNVLREENSKINPPMGGFILGTSGVRLKNKNGYRPNEKIGWNGIKAKKAMQVDLVGHAWFFPRMLLGYFYAELPLNMFNGEDIWFSYLCQKYGRVLTFVPPHLDEYPEYWGSNLELGGRLGSDTNASWLNNPYHFQERDKIVKHAINNEWRLCNENFS